MGATETSLRNTKSAIFQNVQGNSISTKGLARKIRCSRRKSLQNREAAKRLAAHSTERPRSEVPRCSPLIFRRNVLFSVASFLRFLIFNFTSPLKVVSCGFVDRGFWLERSTNSHQLTQSNMSEDLEFNSVRKQSGDDTASSSLSFQ